LALLNFHLHIAGNCLNECGIAPEIFTATMEISGREGGWLSGWRSSRSDNAGQVTLIAGKSVDRACIETLPAKKPVVAKATICANRERMAAL